jgi:hypothetical protein
MFRSPEAPPGGQEIHISAAAGSKSSAAGLAGGGFALTGTFGLLLYVP